ncbi:sensor histidine kinase [Cerasicoccus fimbriatus]|uniref:sensor histidine kinase n=1 Tax=Cerasicoccus fimbriatus TaxID=3014554 RepID=UPI0022B48D65|nr:HAMP domain-containing sensor histidine kinase [Cerasicoccus sp. TK19100]
MPLSLKWKIQLWHTLILGVVLSVLGTGFYFYEKAQRMAKVDQMLDIKVPPLMGEALNIEQRQGPRGNRAPRGQRQPRDRLEQLPESAKALGWELSEGSNPVDTLRLHNGDPAEAFAEAYADEGYYAQVTGRRSGAVIIQTPNFPDGASLPPELGHGYFHRTRDGAYRELIHSNPSGYIFVGKDLAPIFAELNILKLQIGLVTAGIFLVGISVSYWQVSRSLRPLKHVEGVAAQIADGVLTVRIPESTKGNSREFDELVDNLNESFQHMENLMNRQARFTADASHELRTPLTALMAQIELGLKRERTTEEYKRLFTVCARSAERIQRITEQLIELSRFDSGRAKLDYEELPLEGMLLELTEELEAYANKRGSELRTSLSSGVIRCDPFRLEQVLTNLVNNAIQHNNRPITIVLSGWFEGDLAIIEVSDNGKGIQEENLEKLFDRFFQESSSHTSRHNNVGLGLAISKAIVEAHGGKISVTSTPEVKTTFRITLPQQPKTDKLGPLTSAYNTVKLSTLQTSTSR